MRLYGNDTRQRFATYLHHKAKIGDRLPLGAIHLVGDGIAKDRITTVVLDLTETPEKLAPEPLRMRTKLSFTRALTRSRRSWR